MQIESLAGAAARETVPGRRAQQSDYLTFLNMLTVQMQNQDPFNPMNASDFASQLAQFSAVEQQTMTNQLLSALLTQGNLAEMSGWVGMEARLYSGAYFSGDPISLNPDPALGADEVILTVRDESGQIVDTRALLPGTTEYEWDGLDDSGQPLPPGQYRFAIESRLNGDTLDTQPVAAYVRILEARLQDGGTILVLPGGQLVDSGAVTGLRRPPEAA